MLKIIIKIWQRCFKIYFAHSCTLNHPICVCQRNLYQLCYPLIPREGLHISKNTEREKWHDKRRQRKVKPVEDLNEREKRRKQKYWRRAQHQSRERKKVSENQLIESWSRSAASDVKVQIYWTEKRFSNRFCYEMVMKRE